jgi:fructose-1,6-bisphosphatase/sedoheptulose 1,7-bisphosphatase-like protein
MERSCSTTIKPSSRNALTAVRAGEATAKSIRARGGAGFGQNVRIQHKKTNPLIKQTLQAIVEKCEAMGVRMNEQEGVLSTT